MAPSSPSAAQPPSSEEGEPAAARGYTKRGDGFSVQETEGLLLQIRDRWQEGWDVVAEMHNAQFPGHKRTASSLKRKFAKLYRTKIDASTKEKHVRAAALAKKVREEMRGQRRGLVSARALSDDLVAETDVHEDLSEMEMIKPQAGSQPQVLPESAVVASEHELRQTLTESVAMAQDAPMRDDAWQAAINRLPVAGDRLRTLRAQIENGETLSNPDLVQTVLLVLLESQHQRDLEREQDREERRQERLRWQEELREQRHRHEQERVEERRRTEQFMQVMTTLVAQIAAGQQQRAGLN
ncbi:unnamed protein product [Phytophthora fragariaefolia]|uniref:Unnamed protein product n=1 Tax=Phytophthora fragariaefolia TaxID=1490495 RepID=A0A9W6X6Y3_9STRA|nr:unnamed protein product [Phytophthora fragariaefolia]